MLVVSFIIFASFAINSLSAISDDGTLVKIESGLIRGRIRQSETGKNYWAFQEIPYAAPPLGENRFQLPQSPKPWSDVLNTTKNTKICYQQRSRYSYLQISEDCLYINVYTPVKPGSNQSLPVILWIHGGGFVSESGIYEYYGPKYIMDHGVVVVSFNYRLGPFGFLATDDGVIPPSVGMEDQIFAMKWVQRNIQQFGGDRNHVTIQGESAGSAAVGQHLLGPWKGEQLFHAAIMQSGAPLMGSPIPKNFTTIVESLAKEIDPTFSPNNTTDLLKFLQKADAKDITKQDIRQMSFNKPLNLQHLLDGNYKKVPVIIGFNSEETIFQLASLTTEILKQADDNPASLISDGMYMSEENRKIAGNKMKAVYTNNGSFVDHPGAFVRHSSDQSFTIPACKTVEICSKDVPYYLYQFAYKGPLGGQMSLPYSNETGRVGHAEDLHYMWEEKGTNSDLDKFPKEDRLMLHRYVKMWTNFAKYFNPTPEKDPFLGNVQWLKSEPQTLRYLNINSTLEMRENPRQYREIKGILETYMEKPYDFFD
ncbi:unnamed protein product [Phyllotreta striolata]|uniref:Carboxylic ester hydrolase n=1 Tax=Phyllotreta striolata TaxID=444603 RepID=A0A9N9TT26_PHYSR|nr:unnamed protein product [Phyllotreta striolata]